MFYLVLKFWQLGSVPVSLYWDEVAMLVDAKSVAETGKDMFGTTWLQPMFVSYGDYKLPIYIWFATLAVQFFGVSVSSFRLVSVCIGFLQLIVFTLFVKKLFHLNSEFQTKLIQLSTVITAVLTPWFFHFSGVGFEGFLGQFFVSVSLLIALYAKDRKWLWPLVAMFGAIGVYSYYSVRFVWPVVMMALMISDFHFFKEKEKYFTEFKKMFLPILTIGLWSVLLFPLLWSTHYQASQNFRLSTPSILNDDEFVITSNILRQDAGNGVLSRVMYHRTVLRGKQLLKNYTEHISPSFLFLNGDINLRHGTGNSGLLLFSFVIPFFLSLYHLFKQNKRVLFFLSIWILIGILPAAVPLNTPHALRSLNSLFPLIILTSYGVFLLIQNIFTNKTSKLLKNISVTAMFLIFLNSVFFFHDYFGHYPSRSAEEWQTGYTELAQYLDENRTNVRTIWVNSGDDRFYLWYLAFSKMSGAEIQQQQYSDYKLKMIENIQFSAFNWNDLGTLDHKILVVERPGKLDPEWINKTEIYDSLGKVQFEVGEYGQ